jgi:hypothetical protein
MPLSLLSGSYRTTIVPKLYQKVPKLYQKVPKLYQKVPKLFQKVQKSLIIYFIALKVHSVPNVNEREKTFLKTVTSLDQPNLMPHLSLSLSLFQALRAAPVRLGADRAVPAAQPPPQRKGAPEAAAGGALRGHGHRRRPLLARQRQAAGPGAQDLPVRHTVARVQGRDDPDPQVNHAHGH